ncbi:MAG: hypothetical protein ACI9FD_002194 [Gammaproteobacteria bacterium]|jgi:hypothetical protein
MQYPLSKATPALICCIYFAGSVYAQDLGLGVSVGGGFAPATGTSPSTEESTSGLLKSTMKLGGSIKIASNSPQLRLKRALHFENQGLIEDARKDYFWLIDHFPQRPEAYNNLARLLARDGHLDQAVELLEQGLSTHKIYREIANNLTKIYSALATRAYQKALIEPIDQKSVEPFNENIGLELTGVVPSSVLSSSDISPVNDSSLLSEFNQEIAVDNIPMDAVPVHDLSKTNPTESESANMGTQTAQEPNSTNFPRATIPQNLPAPLDPNI